MPTTMQQPEEHLALIRQMMDSGRKRAGVDGSFMLVWGPLLALGFAVHYLAVTGHFPAFMEIIWWPVLLIGWLLSFLVGRRRARTGAISSAAGRLYGISWLGTGIAILAYFIPATLVESFNPLVITVLTCGLFGTSYFVMALSTGISFLGWTALGWYLLLAWYAGHQSMASYDLLVLMSAALLLICLPGFLLSRNIHMGRSNIGIDDRNS